MKINSILKKLKLYRCSMDITIEEVINIIKNDKTALLLDVRSPQEYSEGHLNRCS